MKWSRPSTVVFLLVVCFAAAVRSQSSAFTYQGKLTDSSFAANGQYDFQFSLYDTGGAVLATGTIGDVQVTAGIFTVVLDFGPSLFTSNSAASLEIGVRPGVSTGSYTILAPRQPITTSPFAIKADSASSSDSLSASCALCVTDAHISSVSSGKIAGVLSASQGGTGIGPAYPPADVYLRSNGFGWTLSGLAGDGSAITNLNGASITNNSITAAALSADAKQTRNSLLGSLRWDLLRNQSTFATGATPRGMAFDGANIWVATIGTTSVSKLRASDGFIVGTYPTGSLPIGVAFDGVNIWVANLGTNNVTKIRASDGANLGTFTAGASPVALAFDGVNMWVLNATSNNVQKLRVSDGSILSTYTVPANSESMAFDGANMWIVSRTLNSAIKMRITDGTVLNTFSVGSNPQGVAFDGENMWFADTTSPGSVTKLRASDGANLGSFAVGNNPEKIVFDGLNIWISNSGSNTVTRLRASDGTILGTFAVGSGPYEMAFDGTNVWVSNSSGGSVTRLFPAF